MAWSLLQSVGATLGGSTATTLAATYPNNVVSGSKLIAAVAWGATAAYTITSIKDAAGNTMTALATATGSVGGNFTLAALYAMDTPAGDVGIKPVITLTMSNNNPSPSLLIQEVSGLLAGNTAAMFDGTAGTVQANSTAAGAIPAPSYSSTAVNEYLVNIYGDQGGGITWTAPAGYTADTHGQNASTNADLALCYKNSTGGAETGNYSLSAGIPYALILGAFKISGAAPSSLLPQQIRMRRPATFTRIAGQRAGAVYGR